MKFKIRKLWIDLKIASAIAYFAGYSSTRYFLHFASLVDIDFLNHRASKSMEQHRKLIFKRKNSLARVGSSIFACKISSDCEVMKL